MEKRMRLGQNLGSWEIRASGRKLVCLCMSMYVYVCLCMFMYFYVCECM